MQLSDKDQHIVREIWDADLSLCEVWRTHKGAQALDKVPFEGATAEYLNHLRTAERSPAYIRGMGYVLAEFRDLLLDRDLNAHTTSLLQREMKHTRNAHHKRARMSSFYAWCQKKGYIRKAPDLTTERVSTAPRACGSLGVEQCKSLIEHCPESLRGHLWLRLCMGLRVSEANNTEMLELRDRFLIVGAKAAKTRTRRVMELLDGHEQWWKAVKPLKSLRERFEQLRESAGIHDLPRNAMRQTAASHWLNFYQDEAKAALHLGHSPAMLHRHYNALVTRRESEEFFELWR